MYVQACSLLSLYTSSQCQHPYARLACLGCSPENKKNIDITLFT